MEKSGIVKLFGVHLTTVCYWPVSVGASSRQTVEVEDLEQIVASIALGVSIKSPPFNSSLVIVGLQVDPMVVNATSLVNGLNQNHLL